MNKELYKFLMRNRLAAARITQDQLSSCPDRRSCEQYQVNQFNAVWKVAKAHVPFYREWACRYKLPDAIQAVEELQDWPILTKADLRDTNAFRRTDVPKPKGRIMTGGSTGVPVRLPSFGNPNSAVLQVIGRSWYGYEAGDRVVLIWGHEHLYGGGLGRLINIYKRRVKDWVSNWVRISAYDLSELAMRKTAMILQRADPDMLIGYSGAVLALVRANKGLKMRLPRLKVVICSSAALTSEQKEEIASYFNVPLAMEYGSVECGVMAHTRPRDGLYDVFWNSHLIQAVSDNFGMKNIVTCLKANYVPIIRYDIGDYLELMNGDSNAHSIFEFKDVLGRPSELITFSCGVSFFGRLVAAAAKQVERICSTQLFVDEPNNCMEIHLTAMGKLTEEDCARIKDCFSRVVEGMERISFKIVQVDRLFVTVAGKTPTVVRKTLSCKEAKR